MSGESFFRTSEQSALAGSPSFYTGTGKAAASIATKGKFTGKKKGGLAALIVMLVMGVGGGAFLGSSNSLLAPALEALTTDQTNTQHASSTLRSNRLTSLQLKGATSIVETRWTGHKKYTNMTVTLKNRLKKANIEVQGWGTGRKLVFTNKAGETIDIEADDFLATWRDNVEFREAFDGARYNKVINFFDNVADRIYKKLGISRNLFDDYKQTGDADADEANFRETMTDKMENASADLTTGGNETHTEGEGDDAETVTEPDTDSIDTDNIDGETSTVKASKFIDGLTKVSQGIDISCAILKVANLISMTVAANEIYQSINYFMGLMENISKMKAGEGDESAVNEVLNFLTTTATTSTSSLSGDDGTGKLEQTGTPLESNGLQLILANATVNSGETQAYSIERVSKSITGALAMGAGTATACSASQIASGVISIATSIGPGGIVKIIGGFFLEAAANVAIATAVSAALSFLIPTIAQSLFTNAFETATGIPAGELYAKGGAAANTRVGRAGSGQSLSSSDAALAYNQATQTILALEAEVDRANRSPFDITSRNTFLGSIAYTLASTMTNSNSTSNLNTLMKTTSTSLAQLTGNVSASGEGSSYMTTFGDCPDLNSIGAVGDIYCNPVTSTDLSTINIDPSTDRAFAELMANNTENCDDEGNCDIKDDSNLAKYITFCAERDSPFGVLDAGILSSFESDTGVVLNSIPIVGDIIGIIDGVSTMTDDAQAWSTGLRCTNSAKNADFWDREGKYYQRYVEDQRLLEQMGAYEDSKNPVTAYQEKYDAEHPLDTSTAGLLAHYTGMTKDDAEFIIAFIDYSNFLADYDPENRLALDGDTNQILTANEALARADTHVHFEETGDKAPTTLLVHYVAYADLRNRSYAA